MPQRIQLTEADLGQVATPDAEGRFVLQLITPGWGSSGHYSAQVLEAAGKAGVFKAGTKTFLDHPSYSESQDRPERSVRDIAGMLTEDARWDSALGALVAEAQVFGPYREVLTEMKDAIGVSIRATAQVESGEAEGRQGIIVQELIEGVSADYVTDAGRGGKILQVLESARPHAVVERAIAHGVTEATANDTREALQTILRDAYGGEKSWVWVRDFDDTTVWFENETPDESGTYAQTYELADDGAASLTGERTEVRARTEYVPVTPTGTVTQESLEDHMAPKIEVDEAENARVTAAAARVSALEVSEAAAVARATKAESALALSSARDTARPIATTLVGESTSLPPVVATRVIEAAVAGVTLSADGVFDEAAFRTAVEAARTTAETEVASIAEAMGVGKVVNFGHDTTNQGDVVAEAEKAAAGAFGRQIKEA